MRVKIVGAGSAGMHHAHAARQLGWNVDLVDTSEAAIKRLPEIYAQRYGAWDETIKTWTVAAPPGYSLAIVATPPESHVELALRESVPVLIEKPLCAPHQVREAEKLLGRKAYVGYLHCLYDFPTDVGGLDVSWCENWSHILKAHPWLNSVDDSYLGSWERGGGPAWEHSHGINLWQHIARAAGHGEVDNWYGYVDDHLFVAILSTEDGLSGNVEQNVVSDPPNKQVNINGRMYHPERSFVKQLEHVAAFPSNSPIDVKHGLSTARILADIRPRPSE